MMEREKGFLNEFFVTLSETKIQHSFLSLFNLVIVFNCRLRIERTTQSITVDKDKYLRLPFPL